MVKSYIFFAKNYIDPHQAAFFLGISILKNRIVPPGSARRLYPLMSGLLAPGYGSGYRLAGAPVISRNAKSPANLVRYAGLFSC